MSKQTNSSMTVLDATFWEMVGGRCHSRDICGCGWGCFCRCFGATGLPAAAAQVAHDRR